MNRRRIKYNPEQDYYQIIGVNAKADAEMIQRAYRQQAKRYHPDLNQDRLEWAKDQFQLLNEAYSILSHPESRREYDQLRWPYQNHSRRTPASASTASDTKRPPFSYSDYYSPAEKARQRTEQPRSQAYEYTRPRQSGYSPYARTTVTRPSAGSAMIPSWFRPIYDSIAGLMSSPYRYVLWGLAILVVINSVIILAALQASSGTEDAEQTVPTATLQSSFSGGTGVTPFVTIVPSVTPTLPALSGCTDDLRFIGLYEGDTLTAETEFISVYLQMQNISYYALIVSKLEMPENRFQEITTYQKFLPPDPRQPEQIIDDIMPVFEYGGESLYKLELEARRESGRAGVCTLTINYEN